MEEQVETMEEQMETEEIITGVSPDEPLYEYLDCLYVFDYKTVEMCKEVNRAKRALREARAAKKFKVDVSECYQPPLEEELPPVCNHEVELKDVDMLHSYEIVYAYYVTCLPENSFKKKKSECVCHIESCKEESRLHACLSCIYFACFENRHIHQHAKENIHFYAVDIDSGNIFCSSCEDYIYPDEYTAIARKHNILASCKKVSKIRPFKWEPTFDEVLIMQDAFEKNELVFDDKIDIKGIVNYGKFTCYFNVLVQCLTHAPVFKDYLISLEHKCSNKEACFICQLMIFVQATYSGKDPFHAVEIFRAFRMHKEAEKFRTTEQEDSHDCFSYMIDCFVADAANSLDEPWVWSCIIKDTFFFQMGKERICKVNGCVYPPYPETEEKTLGLVSIYPNAVESFEKLLEGYLITEINDLICDNCKSCGIIYKSFPTKLPDIMNLYVSPPKEIGKIRGIMDTIDMKPFVKKNSAVNDDDDNLEYKYYLCAIVEHLPFIGVNLGHYVCYIRHDKDTWVYCDDTNTTKLSTQDVLKQNATMLFFHKVRTSLEMAIEGKK